MRAGDFSCVSDYLHYVVSDPTGQEFAQLIDAISTNLTSFFREINHFHFLSHTYLPNLIQKKRKAPSNRIRAWSAGCSSGEEPYSLAITILEALENSPSWDVKILATDISHKVLKTAIEGIYDKSRIDPVPPLQKTKYLIPSRHCGKTSYEIVHHLRDLICFRHLNLMDSWPFKGPFDFIFCRNVMIYFDKNTQQNLVGRFWECLETGGLLFTGHSESLTGITHKFRYLQPTIYAKP
jgi:chemotaxis protein methyltransferase CheR